MAKNSFYFPEFTNYFIRQWAPTPPFWTGVLLELQGEKKLLQTNQAVEALFSSLKNHQLSNPEREKESLRDFTKRSGVWEVGRFLQASRDRFR